MTRAIRIRAATVGGGHPLALIAGPCVIESEEACLRLAAGLAEIAGRLGADLVFKASFDKANRTSLSSFRGPGLDEGLRILARVREETDLPVLSDVHEVSQVAAAAEVLDVLQVPAFLCRQTDLLLAAGAAGRPVNLKKGQFLAPGDVRHAVAKVRSTGNDDVLVTERGTSFGYGDLVADLRGLAVLRETGAPVVFDATHAVQRPGAAGGASGGERRHVPALARAAAAAGIDALFLEVHDDPDAALSDGPNTLPLHRVEAVLRPVLDIDRIARAAMASGDAEA
ncbi:MAG: 3-deoxy-8-phosphooctulonate synthase [Gemmatimonadota bacterium]|nr:3-deoxy-8-phosphooctulonate synthase [Gemmatimonadota bacterium]